MERRGFYSPDGVPMSEDEFVSCYGKRYYIGGGGVPRSTPCCMCIENEIDRLLKCGIKEKLDVVHILAWKIGKIKHYESEQTNKFRYAADWARAERFEALLRKRPFDLDGIASFVVHNIDELEQQANENPQIVLDRLNNEQFAGMGPVYFITLLYFISKGKYPIYDHYAKVALNAIIADVKPGEVVTPPGKLPDKSAKAFTGIMSNEMQEYINQIEQIFGKKYLDSRDIDRALWVYGHFFKLK